MPDFIKQSDFISPKDSKTSEISIVGPPNSGKSSLFNKLIGGHNISAVSDKSNTTFDAITGYFTNHIKHTQVVIHDTPGITKRYSYSKHFVTKAWEVID